MASGPITSQRTDGETMATVTDFIFLGSKITADGDYSYEIKRRLLLERKAMTNLNSILKSRDITLPTRVRIIKDMVFPGVMYGCEIWTKKVECGRTDTFELQCWFLATHSSTLAWKIPWTEEPGRLQSLGLRGVKHYWATSLSLFTFMHGEGGGNPLQCSCLQNPRDWGAWWAAVSGVAQSRTRLKQLSSSSSSWFLRVPWTAKRLNQSILKEIKPK